MVRTTYSPNSMLRGNHAGSAPSTAERYVGVDVARIFAAFLIVAYHCMEAYARSGGPPVLGMPPHHIVGGAFLWGRVPFFLILAGFLASQNLARPTASSHKFIYSRLLSLGIPYLVWNGISLLLRIAGEHMGASYEKGTTLSLGMIAAQITGISQSPANGPLWLVRDLIIANLLAPLLFRFRAWIFIPAIILITLPDYPTEWIESSIPRVASIGFYSIGIMLQQLEIKRFSILIPSARWGFLLCLGFGLLIVFTDLALPRVMGPTLGAAAILFAGNAIASTNSKIACLLQGIASASFLIYAANVPIIAVIRQVLLKYGHLSDSGMLLFYSLLPFLLTALLAYFHHLVRKHFPRLLTPLTGGR